MTDYYKSRRAFYMDMVADPAALRYTAQCGIESGGSEVLADLTFIAEALGELEGDNTELLLRFLAHPSAVVREGALYGLSSAKVRPDYVRDRIALVAGVDPDATIREIATAVLEDM